MPQQPHCSLCSGELVREQKVEISVSPYPQCFTLAWVCRDCSAAFPIALGEGGIIRTAKPLYEHGRRLT